jgi:ketosteroid isomerase-like protein
MGLKPSTVIRAVVAALNAQDWAALKNLIAQDAEIETGSSPGQRIRGRDAYIAQLQAADRRWYDLSLYSVEDIDAECAVVTAGARVPLEGGGFNYQTFHWLAEVREGRLARSRMTDTAGGAREAMRSLTHGSSLSARIGARHDCGSP